MEWTGGGTFFRIFRSLQTYAASVTVVLPIF